MLGIGCILTLCFMSLVVFVIMRMAYFDYLDYPEEKFTQEDFKALRSGMAKIFWIRTLWSS